MLCTSRVIFIILFASLELTQGVSELYCRHWLNLFEQGDSVAPNGCCELEVGNYAPVCRANARLYQDFCPCANNPGGQTVIDDSIFTNRLDAFASIFASSSDVHDFIWKTMKTVYYGSDYSNKFDHGYWEDNRRQIYSMSASDFVSHLTLDPPDKATKWISDGDVNLANIISKSHTNDLGFEFEHVVDDGHGYLQVTRLIPGSSTHTSSMLKRGHFIKEIDGVSVPLVNAHEWFHVQIHGKNTVNLKLFTYDNEFVNQGEISVSKSSFVESPVQTHKIIETGNKKLGYLMYNFFPQSTAEVGEVLTHFKNEGIHELILDFRLNSGGYISSVLKLGAMLSNHTKDHIAVNIKANSIVDKFYNLDLMEADERYAFFNYTFSSKEKYEEEMGDMISKFHVITSESTAGAAELLIMGMQQYVPVRLVGERTAGDFLLSSIFPYSATNSSLEVVSGIFRPMDGVHDNFHQSFNWTQLNECGELCKDSGFSPHLKVMSHETWKTMKDFGDVTEEMLHATLTGETHSSPSRRRKLQQLSNHKKINKKRGVAII